MQPGRPHPDAKLSARQGAVLLLVGLVLVLVSYLSERYPPELVFLRGSINLLSSPPQNALQFTAKYAGTYSLEVGVQRNSHEEDANNEEFSRGACYLGAYTKDEFYPCRDMVNAVHFDWQLENAKGILKQGRFGEAADLLLGLNDAGNQFAYVTLSPGAYKLSITNLELGNVIAPYKPEIQVHLHRLHEWPDRPVLRYCLPTGIFVAFLGIVLLVSRSGFGRRARHT